MVSAVAAGGPGARRRGCLERERVVGRGGLVGPDRAASCGSGRLLAPQAVLHHAVPEGVPGDPEPRGRPRDVAPGLAQGLDEMHPLHAAQRRRERGRLRRRPGLGVRARWRRRQGGQPEKLRSHHRRLREEHDPLHHVRQLPHVPGPRVREECRARVRREAPRGESVLRARPAEEALREEEHVLAAVAQRRKGQRHHGEAVIEVLAESSRMRRACEVLVAGRDDPDVDGLTPGAAEPPDGAVLERLEELGLERLRQETHLVQEDRPVVGRLEEAGLRMARVREGAALVAEELGLEQGLGDRRAVDVDELPGGPRPGAVEGPREQPLAHARLALDQDGRQPATLGLPLEKPRRRLADRDDPRAVPEQLGQERGCHGSAHPTPAERPSSTGALTGRGGSCR